MTSAEQQFTVPSRLREAVAAGAGEPGAAWLAALPELLAAAVRRWELTVDRVVQPGGRAGLVLYVRRADGTPAALKLAAPGPASAQEHAALAHWNGRGAVRLLAAAPEDGALLLERLHGEVPLRSLAESRAMLEAAGTLQRLWVAPPPESPFTTLAEHAAELCAPLRDPRPGPLVAELRPLLDEALETAAGLLADQPEQLLLHGDFHHGNVLAGDRAPWLAIDPDPLVGERAYDLAWLAQDRLDTLSGSPGPQSAARRRLRQLSDAVDVDRERLRGWTLVRTTATGLRCLDVGDTGAAELYLDFAAML
ncbi:aminoglycoside phosphotransferase family protein [Streptacidiphilus sp. P02-A3a]|uniref:aminoglycoside phosphotransferase family protein n=1 Tax=Streptacidiphilus sp. P02-A3a TaxID=2704468 RepID=UPI0015FB62FF|nr:aminoglycoside phosphotransferase family protein [Streptacidiphilus sp. P02-A3a]QMU72293.1 phosphotransferase [Streptacidiphilus sp. P02-A3a]